MFLKNIDITRDSFIPGIVEISGDDIAHSVDITTGSPIRTLSDVKGEKLIEIKEGKIRVADLERLKNLTY